MTGPQGGGSLEREPEVMVVDDDRDWGFLVELARTVRRLCGKGPETPSRGPG